LSELEAKCEIHAGDVVDTQSNLNSDVLEDIAALPGIDYSAYATKRAIIDGNLLYYRNQIAHGENLQPLASDYDELHDEVIWLVNAVRNDIENAALVEAFRRQP
jgi:HEPN superfamily RiboL-PSP-like protein